jgi:hypothetical protein
LLPSPVAGISGFSFSKFALKVTAFAGMENGVGLAVLPPLMDAPFIVHPVKWQPLFVLAVALTAVPAPVLFLRIFSVFTLLIIAFIQDRVIRITKAHTFPLRKTRARLQNIVIYGTKADTSSVWLPMGIILILSSPFRVFFGINAINAVTLSDILPYILAEKTKYVLNSIYFVPNFGRPYL